MDLNKQKELISLAHIHSLTAQAGFSVMPPQVDDDSVDLVVTAKMLNRPIRNPSIDLQLKCTSVPVCANGEFTFSLSLKNYNDLRAENVLHPRYLILVVVPENVEGWVEHIVHNELIVRQCAYWVSIKGYDDTSNTSNVSINIPVNQVLHVNKLRELLLKASERT